VPVVSSIFLVAALVLAVVIGPQTRPWTWGPAMLALGISIAATLPEFWKKGRFTSDFGVIAMGTLVAGWFAWRAWISPVAELGQADLMLLAGVVGTFISIRGIEGNPQAERILIWGIALLLLANLGVVGRQITDPSFTPVFRERAAGITTGFYAHYNEAANYFIASSLLVAASAVFGKHGKTVRIFWGILAIAGFAAVYFTRSRGGILGVAVGCGVFAFAALVIGKRRGARWFAPALIAIPVLGLILGGFLYSGWVESQELRHAGNVGKGIEGLMDNTCRLYFLGIAMSCIGLHPLVGGGSRSYSWECFRFVDAKSQGGIITHKPEQVHNELVQAATDYGLIGAGLLIILLGTLLVLAMVRMLFSESSGKSDCGDAWRLGGLAALAGMFVQSNFSFVFHLMPGAVLLGICLGQMARTSDKTSAIPQRVCTGILITIAALACMAVLVPAGWKGTQVTRILWPGYFSKVAELSYESRIDALTEAIRLWPQPSLYQDRALTYQSSTAITSEPEFREASERAIRDYQKAGELHPYDPGPVINRANLLSQLAKDSEAEEAYSLAIHLQGGMEPAFRGYFSLASHFLRKGLRQFNPEEPSPALASMETAAQEMEKAIGRMHWVIGDMVDSRVSIHESLGTAREANGDYQGAMEAYDFAAKLQKGSRAHYRAGVLNGKMAALAWSDRRPGDALGYFMEAKNRINLAKELPQGVTPSQRVEYLAYLDQTIAFLKGAKVEPIKPETPKR
jgi:tetratricopeptide (TPR) repeat protein/O-antigen ligase